MWLLAAVIPVQGMTAVAMLACGPTHHRMVQVHDRAQAQAHAQDLVSVDGDDRHHYVAAIGSDDAALSGPEHGTSQKHHATSASDSLQNLAKFKCSACAPCCGAAALPAAIFTFDAFMSADLPAPVMLSTAPVFLTDGPERPPRLLLV